MGYDRAMRLATDQINMELRAGQVYWLKTIQTIKGSSYGTD
jgi:hypothetical protein